MRGTNNKQALRKVLRNKHARYGSVFRRRVSWRVGRHGVIHRRRQPARPQPTGGLERALRGASVHDVSGVDRVLLVGGHVGAGGAGRRPLGFGDAKPRSQVGLR